MKMDRRIGALAVALVAALIAAGPLAAQDIAAPAAPAALQALSVEMLAEQYGTEVADLEALVAEGYQLNQLRFALELAMKSGSTLETALVAMEDLKGLGWGAMSEALGIEKGEGASEDKGHRGGPAGQGGQREQGSQGGQGEQSGQGGGSGNGGGNRNGKGGH